GQMDSALSQYATTGPLRSWVPTVAAEGYVYGVLGRRREAQAALARMDSLSRRQYVTAYAVALVHTALGQRDSAFAWLAQGVREGLNAGALHIPQFGRTAKQLHRGGRVAGRRGVPSPHG